jgi:hypothetical protein
MYSAKLLDDNKPLNYYNIGENGVKSSDEIFLYVTLTSETEIIVKVKPDATIHELKVDICGRRYLDCKTQELTFEDRILRNIKKLVHYDIEEGSTLHLVPKFLKGFLIKIEAGDNAAYEMEVYPYYFVMQLKYMIQDRRGIALSKQKLNF